MDWDEPVFGGHCAVFFHGVPSIQRIDARAERKVVVRWWRRCGPFQGAPIPRVAPAGQFFTVFDGDGDLDDEGDNADTDQRNTDPCCDKVAGIEGVFELAQAAGDAHQTKDIERHKRKVEPNDPAK